MAHASFDAEDSLLGSSTSLLSLPILYPPSASTVPFPARHHPRLTPPAIDPDLPPSDFDDAQSLFNSPDEHSRSIRPAALADGDEDEQDSDAELDDDQFRAKMERDILGEEGEMSREEEKVSRRAFELGSRIMKAELAARQADGHSHDLLDSASRILQRQTKLRLTARSPVSARRAGAAHPHGSNGPQPPSRQTLLRLLRSLEHDEWRYSPEELAGARQADADFVPYGWIGGRREGKAPKATHPRREASEDAEAGMDVDPSAATAAAAAARGQAACA
jgi:hypothetical protein